MRTKHLFMALALPTVFAACTADDILEQGSNVNVAERKVVGEIEFVNSDINSRLVYDNGLKWTETDKLGAALMDELKTGDYNTQNPASNYTIGNKIYSNYQYDYNGTSFSNGNAVLVEGNYFVYAQFNKNQKRSGLAYSIEANQETGTGYDAWYENQFFLDHIFVKQGDSQVGVNVLPVFPKVNMAVAYEGATSGIEVRKVIVKDVTGKFALNGAVNPASADGVAYDALAGVGAKGVEGKKFNAANYQVSEGTLADVYNAYEKALKDYADGVFTLGEEKTTADFVSPAISKFINGSRTANSLTLNYTTPATSVKGVMVLPLSEQHTVANLVIEIYTNKGLVTIAGSDANKMSHAFDFSTLNIVLEEETVAGKAYTEVYKTTPADLEGQAYDAIRFNAGIKNAFVSGLTADALQKVEIGFKDNAILVPNELTVSTTDELKYYLANWYAGKKNQIVGDALDKNTVTVIAAPGEGQKVEIDEAVLAFINNENNPKLKFEGSIEIAAGTSAQAINKIVKGANNLSVVNNASQTWTATQTFTNLTNKGTLTVGTGAQGETAVYTVTNAIVNEGTLTINKTLAGANMVYNVGTLNVNADLSTLVNGTKKNAPAETDIVAAAAANLANGKTVTTLTNYAAVNATNAIVGALTNNANVNVNGTLKVTGASKNNADVMIAASSTMIVSGAFENAKDATITNNSSLNVSNAAGKLTNNGKIVNNGEASCNADGAEFINNKDIEALSNSITLVSFNNAGAEILVADNTALVTIPNAEDSEGRVTFIVDEQADLANIPTCANSLRVTASTINFKDANPNNNVVNDDIVMTAKKHLEFRSQTTMNITYFGTGTEFDNVYFNADDAASEVRFNTYGDLTASKSLTLSKNAMVIVNNNLNYAGKAVDLNNAGRLYVIGKLNFTTINKPSVEGLVFMGNVYCTGGAEANISWASKASTEAVVATQSDLTSALTEGKTEILLVDEVTLTSELNITKNVTIKGGTLGGKTINVTATDVKFEDVTFKGASNSADASTLLWTGGKNITIEGCTFQAGYDWDAIQMGNFADNAVVVIKNNTFIAPAKANADGSYLHIVASTEANISTTAKVRIEGNTFGSFDNFKDNPIKCYGLKKFSQWEVGKNTFASAFKVGGSWEKVQVRVSLGYYKNLIDNYNQTDAYNAFVADEVKALN